MENLQQQLDAACAKHSKLFDQVQYFERQWLINIRLLGTEQYSEQHKNRLRNQAQMDMDSAEIKRGQMRKVSEQITDLKLALMSQNA